MKSEAARIFLSYSRKDGATAAAELRRQLEAENFSIWQDLAALEGGLDWWTQIEDVLRSKTLEHFILIVTPKALESEDVRREIRLARQEGKTICPIRGPGLLDLAKLPRRIGEVYDLDVPERRANLLRLLADPSRAKTAPMMIPRLSTDFVPRPDQLGDLKKLLLDSNGDAVRTTVALRGTGGYGKTTLAKALTHEAAIQDAYFDGILWVELGEEPDVLTVIADLIELVTRAAVVLRTVEVAHAALSEALGDRHFLLIIDDVWRSKDLSPFLQAGGNTTCVITTRDRAVPPPEAVEVPVGEMRPSEALALISRGAVPREAAVVRRLEILAGYLGKWPLLLGLVNGFIRDQLHFGALLPNAVEEAFNRLESKGLEVFDFTDEGQRDRAVGLTLGVSLERLKETEQERFRELCIFPDDVDVPLGVLAIYWKDIGELERVDVKILAEKLARLSLLESLNLDPQTLRVHDVIRRYLREKAGGKRVRDLNGILAEKFHEAGSGERKYFLQNLLWHLHTAGRRDRIDALLLEPGWMLEKVQAVGVQALIGDYQEYAHTPVQEILHRTLGLASSALIHDPEQLPAQLIGRLKTDLNPEYANLVEQVKRLIKAPAIIPASPSLTSPGAELQRLSLRGRELYGVAKLDGRRLVCTARDGTALIWDLEAEREIGNLVGHAGPVWAVAVVDAHRVLTGSADRSIRLWDADTREELEKYEGHKGAVRAIAMLPGRRFASVSEDKMLRIWDLDRVQPVDDPIPCGKKPLLTVLALDERHVVVSGKGQILRVYDIVRHEEIARLGEHKQGHRDDCHRDDVNQFARIGKASFAAASNDGTVGIWKPDGNVRMCKGHSGTVHSVVSLGNGCIASGGSDCTIRIWDCNTTEELTHLEGHFDKVNALAVLDQRRLVSVSSDGTMRIWDASIRPPGVPGENKARPVRSIVSVTALDRQIAAVVKREAVADVWEAQIPKVSGKLEHDAGVVVSTALSAERLACVTTKGQLWVWTVKSGNFSPPSPDRKFPPTVGILKDSDRRRELARAIIALPDGRVMAGCQNGMLRLWSIASGKETRTESVPDGAVAGIANVNGQIFVGWENGRIAAAAIAHDSIEVTREIAKIPAGLVAMASLPTARLVAVSGVGTIHVLRADGSELKQFADRFDKVTGVVGLGGGDLACVLADDRLNLLQLELGEVVATLDGDAPFTSLIYYSRSDEIVAGDAAGRVHWLATYI